MTERDDEVDEIEAVSVDDAAPVDSALAIALRAAFAKQGMERGE